MVDQLYKQGDIIKIKSNTLECVSVAYVEVGGVPQDYVYNFRLKDEVDSDREKAKAEQERVDKINEKRSET